MKLTVDERILLALAELISSGEKNITPYRIAKFIGSETAVIYRRMKQIKDGAFK